MSGRRWSTRVAIAFVGSLALGGALTSPAAANHVLSCGATITQSTVLHNDIGPCQNDGLVVAASNITLDLNGHRIFGNGGQIVVHQAAAVRILNQTGVLVTNGRVDHFYHGVRVTRGSRNQLTGLLVSDNLGGNGIVLENSSDNLVSGNEVVRNGGFSGIATFDSVALPAGSARNTITGNSVRTNNASGGTNGIAIENGLGHVVLGNTVETSARDGISLFAPADNNTIQHNSVSGNGTNGINVRNGSTGNVVQRNVVTANVQRGILVAGQSNRILSNVARANGILDLSDTNAGGTCDANIWSGNVFGTAAPACTQG